MRHLLLVLGFVMSAAVASAQTPPTILVLGVGQVAFDVPTVTLADAQAQAYRAYVGTAAAIKPSVACSGTASPFTCTFPVSALPLTINAQSLALTSAVVAADGEQESVKVVAPFVLALARPPVPPSVSTMRVRPTP